MQRILLVAGLAIVLTGCATVRFKPYTLERYKRTSEVQVYRNAIPDREYTEIGELSIYEDNDDTVLRIIERAKQVGANAIIVKPVTEEGGMFMYGVWVPFKKSSVVAIRYTDGATPRHQRQAGLSENPE